MKKNLLFFCSFVLCIMAMMPVEIMAREKLVIQGSTTVLPIVQKASEPFMKMYPDIEIVLTGTGSGDGIVAMIVGTADIANSSRFIKDKEIKMVLEKGGLPVPFQVAYDCIVPVVHPSNPIQNITMTDLKKIYSGEIKTWKQLGGTNDSIDVISRDPSSGTFEVWQEKVLQKSPQAPGSKLMDSNASVAKAVAAGKNTIGYVGIGYINHQIKALRVDGVEASHKTAVSGKYPVSRPLFMFTRGWPENKVKTFIDFILEPDLGQKYVQAAGYLPLRSPVSEKPVPAPQTSVYNVENINLNQLTLFDEYKRMTWSQKVLRLQTLLDAFGYPTGPLDGIWGQKTLSAYQQFQQDNEMDPDGKIVYEGIQRMELNLGKKPSL
jgi:phosphate transport system substrate-binding protein